MSDEVIDWDKELADLRALSEARKDKRRLERQKHAKLFHERHKDRVIAKSRAFYHANKHVGFAAHIKKKFALTVAEFDAMVAAQNNCCAACGDEFQSSRHRHVDHCHGTGKIRALLCSSCNLAIGFAKDDPVRLERMAVYLRNHKG